MAWRGKLGFRKLCAGAGGWRGTWDCGECFKQEAEGVMQPPGGSFLWAELPTSVSP